MPLLAPSLATAALLVFVDVMKELPATFVLRPFNFDTLAIEAYNLAKDERLAEAALPSLAIVAVGTAAGAVRLEALLPGYAVVDLLRAGWFLPSTATLSVVGLELAQRHSAPGCRP